MPDPYYSDDRVTVFHGRVEDILPTLPDCSVDSVVTDPPYAFPGGFMSKPWDAFTSPRHFQEWCEEWARECYRILKPGGHLIAAGAPRCYHRLASGIEDAGFEVRDSIHHLFGAGFPKSMDVSKAIDKAAGAEREVIERRRTKSGGMESLNRGNADQGYRPSDYSDGENVLDITAPATAEAAEWEGWGTALKPAHEPWVLARKPLVRSVAENVLAYGTGALNIDGCRVGYQSEADRAQTRVPEPEFGVKGDGEGTYNFKAGEGRNGKVFEPAQSGRWPANVVLSHADGCRQVGTRTVKSSHDIHDSGSALGRMNDDAWEAAWEAKPGFRAGYGDEDGNETVPEWSCVPGCPVAALDEQSGDRPSSGVYQGDGSTRSTGATSFAQASDKPRPSIMRDDSGGASRFFPTFEPELPEPGFLYAAKAPRSERPVGPDGTMHATVKPLALMRWLAKLVTPPGGTILEPFAGSGTTIEAAILEGFNVIAVEMTDEYLPLIRQRIDRGYRGGPAYAAPKPKAPVDQPTLF